ncbi:hypothetical protein Tco_0768681 [Tanacetum coccineum]
MSHTSSNKEFSKESFRKQTTLLEKRMDESIPWDQKCKSSKELFKIKKSVDTIFDGVERCKQTIAKRTYFGNIDPFIQNTIEGNFGPQISKLNADLEQFHLCLKEEMVADLRYFNSLEHEVDTLKSQLETQKTQFLNEIDRLSREYYYADHMNAILGVYTDLDEFTNLQCDYVETWEKCEHLEKELSKSRTMSKSFEALQKHAINLELDLQQCKEKIKNDKSFKENQSNVFLKEREQYFEIQDLKAQLQDKGIAISELKKLIEKMKGKSVETKFEKSSVIRQPNAFKSQRQSILGHCTDFASEYKVNLKEHKCDCSRNNCPAFYDNDDEDDDEEYTIRITPVLPTVEPNNSLSMGDKNLSTIPEKKESSAEYLIFFDLNMIMLPSELEDPLYSRTSDYVDASPPDSDLVSLEEVKDFDTEDGEIDTDILLTINNDILREKLLNINLLIAKIETLKDNPTPSTSVLKSPSSFPNSFLEETDASDNSLLESEIFCFDMEEKNMVEDIFDNQTRELYVHVPNVFPTHPSLYLDSNFAPSDDSLGYDLVVSFPSGTRNKIFDPGIFIEFLTLCSHFHLKIRKKFSILVVFLQMRKKSLLHRIALDFEDSRARGFVLRSLELQSLA